MIQISEHYPLILSLLFGPSSICAAIILFLSYRRSLIAELIIPVEAFVNMLTYIVIFDSGLFSNSER